MPAAEGPADTVCRHHDLWRLAGVICAVRRVCLAGVQANLDGLFFAFTMANLTGRVLAYACGSEAQAVAL
jgi:hypothetical protein